MSAVGVVVVVLWLVEWHDAGVVPVVDVAHVVGDDVDHDPDVAVVADLDELLEFFSSTEVLVDLVQVAGDPDSIEAHVLDVVEVVLDALEGAAAVVAEVVAGSGRAVGSGESVGDDLIDRAGSPFFGCSGMGSEDEEGGEEKCGKEMVAVCHEKKKREVERREEKLLIII